jgi:glycosyltransferase involved in cell wall biosynthesis
MTLGKQFHLVKIANKLNLVMNNLPVEKYNLSGKEIREGISLITAVKNREETLRQVLPTWLENPEIKEIVIVDWSSDHSLESLVNEFQDGRIFLAIVEDQAKWVLSYAYNLAARLASRNQILKMDADVKIMPGFFNQHKLYPGHFFTGNWRIARNENETHLNGIAFYYRSDFFKANGFNEFITTYGWDDTDLFDRLAETGLTRSDINPDALYHIPHENRVTHQDGTHFLKNVDDRERATINILMNRYIASNFKKWDPSCKLSQFKVRGNVDNGIVFQHIENTENQVPAELLEKSEIIAIRDRMEQWQVIIHQDWFNLLDKNELIALYRYFLLAISDPALQPDGIKLIRKIFAIKPLT